MSGPYVQLGIRHADQDQGYVDPQSLLPARDGSAEPAPRPRSLRRAPAAPAASGSLRGPGPAGGASVAARRGRHDARGADRRRDQPDVGGAGLGEPASALGLGLGAGPAPVPAAAEVRQRPPRPAPRSPVGRGAALRRRHRLPLRPPLRRRRRPPTRAPVSPAVQRCPWTGGSGSGQPPGGRRVEPACRQGGVRASRGVERGPGHDRPGNAPRCRRERCGRRFRSLSRLPPCTRPLGRPRLAGGGAASVCRPARPPSRRQRAASPRSAGGGAALRRTD